jgi:Fe-S cluster biosynthesis and repair protein YggX
MPRQVQCVVLKQESEGLEKVPHPGELGQRIYNEVSKAGWQQWLERATAIINENKLSTADAESLKLIEKHMLGFFFGEGDHGQLPSGFRPAGSGGKK